MKNKKTKKITSKAYVRAPQSDYVKDRCELLRVLQLLGLITDIRMRMGNKDGKPHWCLTVESEINDDD